MKMARIASVERVARVYVVRVARVCESGILASTHGK